MSNITSLLAVKHHFTQPRNPQANSTVEKFNGKLNQLMKRTIDGKPYDTWDELVQPCVFANNTMPHEETHETPFFMLHGFDPRMQLDAIIEPDCKLPDHYTIDDFRSIIIRQQQAVSEIVLERMRAAQERNVKQGNQSRTKHEFAEGDLILVAQEPAVGEPSKLARSWAGPYRMLRLAKHAEQGFIYVHQFAITPLQTLISNSMQV